MSSTIVCNICICAKRAVTSSGAACCCPCCVVSDCCCRCCCCGVSDRCCRCCCCGAATPVFVVVVVAAWVVACVGCAWTGSKGGGRLADVDRVRHAPRRCGGDEMAILKGTRPRVPLLAAVPLSCSPLAFAPLLVAALPICGCWPCCCCAAGANGSSSRSIAGPFCMGNAAGFVAPGRSAPGAGNSSCCTASRVGIGFGIIAFVSPT